MSARVNLTAKRAAHIIDAIRALAASGQLGDVAGRIVANTLRNEGIDPLVRCAGEAHQNPNVDHCGKCAPRWGALGEAVTVAGRGPT